MTRRVFVALCAISLCTIASGQEPSPTQPEPAAMLLGTPITKDELRARATAAGVEAIEDAELGDILQAEVMRALMAKFVEEHGLKATEEDLAAIIARTAEARAIVRGFDAERAAEVRAQLDDPGITEEQRVTLKKQLKQYDRSAKGELWPDAEDRAELAASAVEYRRRLQNAALSEEERAMLQQGIDHADRFAGLTDVQAAEEWKRYESEVARKAAEPFVVWWKFNRELQHRYGGRILFQQAGPEAFDATRAWLEEREKAGDFTILSPALRDSFWHYHTRTHPMLTDDPERDDLDTPWWMLPDPED